ncbi:hypothetical protein VTJ83DRAFT_203 [Remersonia thermophila]|uniref:Protein kinase domain-containing protein n=1 Tax=Remersonia thermophila TaxID=72144 RepID=A0ABR4DKI1_9PEZI
MSSHAAVASPVPMPLGSPVDSPDLYSSSPDRRRNMPAGPVPPRTSSSRHAQQPNSSSRRSQPDSSRDPQARRANPAPGHDHHYYSANGSRSPPHSPSAYSGPTIEASETLNNILASQAHADRSKDQLALAPQSHHQRNDEDDAAPPPVVGGADADDGRRGGKSRHDYSRREKQTRFGEYILGNTIGEGEFGKVKLGWKIDGGAQVAIKLIKKDQLGGNPSRMAKIMREVAILKQLTHPNIVRLHKMEESERHYGIVLEYASGGELFDYILNHRYLKDNAARRLFAQLVSGVGYLHKKGIVHRDLKLENLLLDRNRNIIITDFGFANTFDPNEELTEEEELNLTDREFVKRMGLDRVKPNGTRKGDLMQTSCGSPCYAAPELVVSDSLYTGRKVDVWSCGVILYAMLAGYLPFDDDPANPEGDNINLLYKYIVNTPLTFPEYVTPHARDLLRRILVPNPRKRADLFEVARHSWLSEYAHVVEFITSSTTTPKDIQNTTVPAEDDDAPSIARSASVRETTRKSAVPAAIGGLASKPGTLDADAEYAKQQRDNKRRTVQVEYVAPNTTTQRGESSSAAQASSSRARHDFSGSVQSSLPPHDDRSSRDAAADPYGKAPASSRIPPGGGSGNAQQAPAPSAAVPVRGGREAAYLTAAGTSGRPATGGSSQSTGSKGPGGATQPYAQPAPPEVADTNAHGKIQQPPRRDSAYGIPSSASQAPASQEFGRPSISVPPKFARVSGFANEEPATGSGASGEVKGHKRSSTMGEISTKLFGRSGSLFGGRNRKRGDQQAPAADKSKKYPPVSMNNALANEEGRPSMESKRSRRSFSIGLGKKASGSIAGSQQSGERSAKRFSFIPGSFSLKAIGIGKDDYAGQLDSQHHLPIQDPPASAPPQNSHFVDQDVGREQPVDAAILDGMYEQLHSPSHPPSNDPYGRYGSNGYGQLSPSQGYIPQPLLAGSGSEASVDRARRQGESVSSLPGQQHQQPLSPLSPLSPQDGSFDSSRRSGGKNGRGVLQKNKRFVDAYEGETYPRNSGSTGHDHSGSSGPARKVMDFFRRRSKARAGELG